MPQAVGAAVASFVTYLGGSAATAATVASVTATIVTTVMVNVSLAFTDEYGETWDAVDAIAED